MPIALYNYWSNADSITHKFNLYRYKSMFAVREKSLEYLTKMGEESFCGRYASSFIERLCSLLYEIGVSDELLSEKLKVMNEMHNHEFYRNFIAVYAQFNDIPMKVQMIYFLFKKKRFVTIVFVCKLVEYLKS